MFWYLTPGLSCVFLSGIRIKLCKVTAAPQVLIFTVNEAAIICTLVYSFDGSSSLRLRWSTYVRRILNPSVSDESVVRLIFVIAIVIGRLLF